MPKGKIRRLLTERGFGFIRTVEGEDLFFHRSQVEGVNFSSLKEGQLVEFEVGLGRDGKYQAVKVRPAQFRGRPTPKAVTVGWDRLAGFIAGIVIALFFGVSLYLRVVLPRDQVIVGEWIKLTGTDAYYFMRQVDNLVHNFPHAMSFDPYLLYPGGQSLGSLSLFVYLTSGIAWLIGLGSPTQHTIDMVGIYLPAVLGALSVIPVYFIGKELSNRWAGVIAACLLAIAPGEFLGRSLLGFADRDTLEVLLTVLTMLFLILAIKSATRAQLAFGLWHLSRHTIKALVYSLLTGICLGLYLLTWRGALMFVFIIFAYFITQSIIDHVRRRDVSYLSFIGIVSFLVALVIFLPSHPLQARWAPLVIALLTMPVLAAASWLLVKSKAKVGYYPLTLLGLGVAGSLVLYVVNPSIPRSMLNLVAILFTTETKATVLEMQPILLTSGVFTLSKVWGNFTTGSFLSLISLGILAYLVIKRGEADKTLMLVWSLVVLAATLFLSRLALFYAINVALLSGYLAWLVLDFAGLKEEGGSAKVSPKAADVPRGKKKRQRASRTSKWLNAGLAIVVVLFLFFYPNLAMAQSTAKEPAFAPSDGWCEAVSWMRDNTPDPFADPDFYYASYTRPFRYPQTAYGVTAWWDYGYLITRMGHRLPNCHPGSSERSRQKVASLFVAQDEASAATIISQLKSRYVIIDYSTAVLSPKYYVLERYYGLSGKFSAVAKYAGSSSKDFYDMYYQLKDNRLVPAPLFYPEYYRSLAVRLYNFDGSEVIPKATYVVSYEEKEGPNGTRYKQIIDLKSFLDYEEAEDYVASQKSGNYRVVGISPFASPVPLEKLERYTLVYSSKNSKSEPYTSTTIPEVKIFEYVE